MLLNVMGSQFLVFIPIPLFILGTYSIWLGHKMYSKPKSHQDRMRFYKHNPMASWWADPKHKNAVKTLGMLLIVYGVAMLAGFIWAVFEFNY